MSRYETVEKAIWADPEFEALPPDAKLLYLWAFTNPLCGLAGIYKVSEIRMQRDTGLPGARASKALAQLADATFVVREGPRLWVRSRVKYMVNHGSKIAAGIAAEVGKLDTPDSIRSAFLEKYGDEVWLRDALAPLRESSEPYGSTEPKPDRVSIGSMDPMHGVLESKVGVVAVPDTSGESNGLGFEREGSADVEQAVLAKLAAVADARDAAQPSQQAIRRAIADVPNVDHLAVAVDLEFWALHGSGANRRKMGVANTYRNFCKRAAQDQRTASPGSGSQHPSDLAAAKWRQRAKQWAIEDGEVVP